MALASAGLQTQIWNNNIKSMILLMLYPLVLMAMMWAFFAFTGYGAERGVPYDLSQAGINGVMEYGHWVFIAAGGWFVVSWFMHQRMINASTGAHSLSRKESPEIYNMLENMCISRGIPMPKLQIMDTEALNAFASGLTDENFTITLTRGIINSLEKDELEAVIGHELSHIRHRDVRLLIISVIFTGMISFLCNMVFRSILWGGSSRRQGGDGRLLIVAMVILGIGYLTAILARFALSRRREYMADAGSVELTRNPDAMIRALRRIEGRANVPNMSGDVKQMCIENAAGFMGGMFTTHPSMDSRVAALESLGGRDSGWLAPIQQKPQSEEASKRTPWDRRHGPWG